MPTPCRSKPAASSRCSCGPPASRSGMRVGGSPSTSAATAGTRRFWTSSTTLTLPGTKPREQWRQLGRWPASYDLLWAGLIERQGRSAGTKAMIELLQLGRRHGPDRLRTAVETALALGCRDAAAVRHLLATPTLAHPAPP